MLKFKTSCAVLAYLSSNLLNEVGLSLFRYFEVGLRVCNIVVKKFTFAISSPDEFLYNALTIQYSKNGSWYTRFWNRFWNFRTGSLEPVPTSDHYLSYVFLINLLTYLLTQYIEWGELVYVYDTVGLPISWSVLACVCSARNSPTSVFILSRLPTCFPFIVSGADNLD